MIEEPLLVSEAQQRPVIRVTGRKVGGFDGVCPGLHHPDDENNECLPYGVTPTENEDRRSS
jgi:hypothetical protein